MPAIPLNWVKCGETNQFCRLQSVILHDVDYNGVFIIWSTWDNKVLIVGEGNIKHHLEEYRSQDNFVKAYLTVRPDSVLVTWARLDDRESRFGVVAFLRNRYSPILSVQITAGSPPLETNLP